MDLLLGFFFSPVLVDFGCCQDTGWPLAYRSGYSALCMRSASVGALTFLRFRTAVAGVVTLATGAVSMIMSRFSEMASAACVLAWRWHRSVRRARRGAAALVQDIAADIGREGWRFNDVVMDKVSRVGGCACLVIPLGDEHRHTNHQAEHITFKSSWRCCNHAATSAPSCSVLFSILFPLLLCS